MRHDPISLTAEDQLIFNWLRLGHINHHDWCGTALADDRRDAALMWSMAHVTAQYGYSLKERHEVLALYFGDPLCGMLS